MKNEIEKFKKEIPELKSFTDDKIREMIIDVERCFKQFLKAKMLTAMKDKKNIYFSTKNTIEKSETRTTVSWYLSE